MTTGERHGTPICGLPPPGWICSRGPKHDGPCAARRDPKVSEKATYVEIKEHTDIQPAFYLSKEQGEAAHDWMTRHDAERHIPAGATFRYSGAIGGAYTWCFTSTSIGCVVVLECSCGERLDVSDYDAW